MSSRRSISQREARRLQRRVAELEQQVKAEHRTYAREYPGGTNIATLELSGVERATLYTAQLLKHPLVLVVSGGLPTAQIFALPAPPD